MLELFKLLMERKLGRLTFRCNRQETKNEKARTLPTHFLFLYAPIYYNLTTIFDTPDSGVSTTPMADLVQVAPSKDKI